MDKSLAVTICNGRNLSAVCGFLKADEKTELKWKENSDFLLLRFLKFMDVYYKCTVCKKMNLTESNCEELRKELRFFQKLIEMNEMYCLAIGESANAKNKMHPATQKIILGTMYGLLQLVVEIKSFRPYRASTSQYRFNSLTVFL